MTSGRARRFSVVSVITIGIAIGALAFTAFYLIVAARNLSEGSCTAAALPAWEEVVLTLACVASLYLGHLLLKKRYWKKDDYQQGPSEILQQSALQRPQRFGARITHSFLVTGRATSRFPGRGGALVVHAALAFFLLAGALALLYETVAVWPGHAWGPPITDFVRCATRENAAATFLVACTVSFLVGHWLWFPGRDNR